MQKEFTLAVKQVSLFCWSQFSVQFHYKGHQLLN